MLIVAALLTAGVSSHFKLASPFVSTIHISQAFANRTSNASLEPSGDQAGTFKRPCHQLKPYAR